jgi:hypothetical protein
MVFSVFPECTRVVNPLRASSGIIGSIMMLNRLIPQVMFVLYPRGSTDIISSGSLRIMSTKSLEFNTMDPVRQSAGTSPYSGFQIVARDIQIRAGFKKKTFKSGDGAF